LLESHRQINDTLQVLFERKEVLNQFSKLISTDNLFNKNSLEHTSSFQMNQGEAAFPGIKNSNSIYYKSNKQHLLDESNYIEDGNQNGLDFISGTVKAENELRMRRMIFRVTRGRALTTFSNFQIDDNETHQNILLGGEIKQKNSKKINQRKKIFTIFFQSSKENIILGKVLKICDLFEASRYSVPRPEEISNTIKEIEMEIREKHNFLCEAEKSMMDFLIAKCGNNQNTGQYHMYKLYFRKEKAIYTNLNKCIVRGNFIDGEVWIPLSKLETVKSTLKNIYNDSTDKLTANLFDIEASSIKETPPTYIPSNEFFFAFQQIVDTYGIPRYREINPALFNVVTFPFLFGVMFGDIGHGLILLIFALYLCFSNNSIKNEKEHFFKSVLPARYLLLLMGFFAFYSGWLYNDFFSIPIESFGSCYQNNGTIAQREDSDCVYLVGIDPKWYSSKNELTYMNSFKMKFSVIL